MAKEVVHSHKIRDPLQPDLGPDRYLRIVACDDGSVYEFQKLEDAPVWNLRSRGSTDSDPSQWTTSRAKLPTDVIDTLNEILGKTKWTK